MGGGYKNYPEPHPCENMSSATKLCCVYMYVCMLLSVLKKQF